MRRCRRPSPHLHSPTPYYQRCQVCSQNMRPWFSSGVSIQVEHLAQIKAHKRHGSVGDMLQLCSTTCLSEIHTFLITKDTTEMFDPTCAWWVARTLQHNTSIKFMYQEGGREAQNRAKKGLRTLAKSEYTNSSVTLPVRGFCSSPEQTTHLVTGC